MKYRFEDWWEIGRTDVNPEHHHIVIQRSGTTDTEQKFRLESLNFGTIRGYAGEVVETMTRRKVDVCCIQEVRCRGASARLITGKNCEYKIYWVGNNLGLGGVEILVAGNWIDKIFDIKHVNDRLMTIKLLIGK